MKSSEVPVIQSELQAVKKLISSQGISLKHDIKSVRQDVKSVKLNVKSLKHEVLSLKHEILSLTKRIDSTDSKIDSLDSKMDSKMDSLDSKIDSLDSKMDSRFNQLHTEIYKVLVVVEEQNARNKVVMDQKALIQLKIEQHDARLIRLEKNK